jgi:hypothetical protein
MDTRNEDDYPIKSDYIENDADDEDDSIYRVVEDDGPPPFGFWKRVTSVIASPFQLMENIKYNPKLLQPIVALLVLSIAVGYLTIQLSDITRAATLVAYSEIFDPATLQTLEASMQAQVMPETPTEIAGVVAITGGTALVGFLMTALLSSLIVFLFCKIAKGNAKYKNYYSMFLHINIVTLLLSIVSMLLMLRYKAAVDFLSLAPVFMPEGTTASLNYLLLGAVSLSNIWSAALVFLGVKALNDFNVVKPVVIAAVYILLSVFVTAVMTNVQLSSVGTALQSAQQQ